MFQHGRADALKRMFASTDIFDICAPPGRYACERGNYRRSSAFRTNGTSRSRAQCPGLSSGDGRNVTSMARPTAFCFALALVFPATVAAGQPLQADTTGMFPAQRPAPQYHAGHARDPWHDKSKPFDLLGQLNRSGQRRALARAIKNRHQSPTIAPSLPRAAYTARGQTHYPQLGAAPHQTLQSSRRATIPGVAMTGAPILPQRPVVQESETQRVVLQAPSDEPQEPDPPLPEPAQPESVAPSEPSLPDPVFESDAPSEPPVPDPVFEPADVPQVGEPDLGSLEAEAAEYIAPFQEPVACPKCRLLWWERVLRCLAPKHRRIPLRSPFQVGPPYYAPTNWQRWPDEPEPSWHPSDEPGPSVASQ